MRRMKHFIAAAIAAVGMMVATAPSLLADGGYTICTTIWWYTICQEGPLGFWENAYAVCQQLGLCP